MDSRRALNPLANFTQSLTVILFIAVLYVARDVLIPLALGILFAFLLSPIVNRLQRWGLSNIAAVLITAGVVFSALGLFLVLLWSGFANLTSELPKYKREVVTKVNSWREWTSGFGGQFQSLAADVSQAMDGAADEASDVANEGDKTDPLDETIVAPPSYASATAETDNDDVANDGSSPRQPLYVVAAPSRSVDFGSWAGGLAAVMGPIGTAGLVTVFALFALIYRDDSRDRFTSIVAHGNYVVTAEALEEASRRVSRYLIAQLILNVSYGAIFAVGLLIIGFLFTPDGTFPYFILLGTIAGVVRFIPYVGPIIGAFVPLLLSIALFPGYSVAIAVAVLIVSMELLSNNVVEPLLYGSSTGVSAVAIILSAVFWGWLWGPIGLLLATPLTVCAVVFGKYVPRFQFLAKLLSEKVHLKRSVRGYQRLLSGDTHKLSEYLQNEVSESSPTVVIDRIITPMIKYVLTDRDLQGVNDAIMFDRLWTSMLKAGLLSDSKKSEVDEADDAAELPVADVETLAAVPGASPEIIKPDSTVAAKQLPHGLAIASRHRGEEILIGALAHHMRDFIQLELLDVDDLPDQVVHEIVAIAPQFIVIAVIPPGGTHQARYWCRSLREAGYTGFIVLGCYGRFKNYDRLFVNFRRAGANWFTTTVDQTLRRIRSVADKSNGPQKRLNDIR